MATVATEFESFAITAVDSEGNLQGQTAEGKTREFALVVHRDVATGELSLGVARHYIDPRSLANFSGSAPWGSDELNRDDEEG